MLGSQRGTAAAAVASAQMADSGSVGGAGTGTVEADTAGTGMGADDTTDGDNGDGKADGAAAVSGCRTRSSHPSRTPRVGAMSSAAEWPSAAALRFPADPDSIGLALSKGTGWRLSWSLLTLVGLEWHSSPEVRVL